MADAGDAWPFRSPRQAGRAEDHQVPEYILATEAALQSTAT